MLTKALDSAPRSLFVDEQALRAEWMHIKTLIGTRVTKAQAPPRVVPTDAPDLTVALALLDQSRQHLLETIRGATYDDLLSISMPHPFPAVGTLTGAGWLSVVAYHDLRHAEQIREQRADVG